MVNFVLLKILLAQTLCLLPSFVFIDMSNETLPRTGGWTHLISRLPARSSQRNGSMCMLASALRSAHLNIVWNSGFILEFKVNEKVFLPSDSLTFEHVNSAKTFLKVSSQKNNSGRIWTWKSVIWWVLETFTLSRNSWNISYVIKPSSPETYLC